MKTITIEGQLRTGSGKKATRQIRSQELVPGVIYGGPQEINFSAPAKALRPLVYTPDFQFALVNIDGKSYRCILKDLQFDKIDEALLHIDLLELVEDKKVIATIPIKYVGAPQGVKDGGRLHLKIKALKIKTYPKYLRENIEVNIEKLELHGNIRVEDVKIEHYEILNSPRIPIASVGITRELKVEEAAATPAAGTAAPAAGAAAPAAAAAPAKAGKK